MLTAQKHPPGSASIHRAPPASTVHRAVKDRLGCRGSCLRSGSSGSMGTGSHPHRRGQCLPSLPGQRSCCSPKRSLQSALGPTVLFRLQHPQVSTVMVLPPTRKAGTNFHPQAHRDLGLRKWEEPAGECVPKTFAFFLAGRNAGGNPREGAQRL